MLNNEIHTQNHSYNTVLHDANLGEPRLVVLSYATSPRSSGLVFFSSFFYLFFDGLCEASRVVVVVVLFASFFRAEQE